MKLGKSTLGIVLGSALSVGMTGQTSADVYGLSYLDIDNIGISITAFGGAGLFVFQTDQDASLNGAPDLVDGSAGCFGVFGTPVVDPNVCTNTSPVLSGVVQNAPGSGVTRAENDYQKFGQTAEYANAESAVISALLVLDPATHTSAISESNLQSGTSARANTSISSNTLLQLTFSIQGQGTFAISFDAIIDVLSEVSGGDTGLAQANSGLTVLLQRNGATIASWTPTGGGDITTCGTGLTCTATETGPSLNNSTSSDGVASQVAGSGNYQLQIVGLSDGDYSLALATTSSTVLARIPNSSPPPPPSPRRPPAAIPVQMPGALFLLASGLLLTGVRALRRRHK